MTHHLMVVLSNVKEGQEEEFNAWYDEHVQDVLQHLDGFIRAQRFRLAGEQAEGGTSYRYLALYEIEEDKLEAARDAILWQRGERVEAIAAGRKPVITTSTTMESPHHSWFFTSCSDEFTAEGVAERA